MNDVESVSRLSKAYADLRAEIGKVIVGQERVIEHLLIALLSRGIASSLASGFGENASYQTLAEALELKFSRIQFTPDLMPSDITGTEIIEENVATGGRPSSLFKVRCSRILFWLMRSTVLLQDASCTPRGDAGTSRNGGGQTYSLQEPFFVLATQNPIEQEGTYPLPEAQLDRFMFNLWLDYPSFKEEVAIVKATTSPYKPDLKRILSAKEIIEFQDLIRRVPVADNVIEYAVTLVDRTSRQSQPLPISSRTGFVGVPDRELLSISFLVLKLARFFPAAIPRP